MCCKVIRIDELEKAAGVWCRHAAPGHGCRIYADRPTPCQVFQCLWLQQSDLPEALRPERTKVVLASSDTKLIAHCDPAEPTAWRREPMYSFLKRQAWPDAGSRPVLVLVGRRIWLVTAAADHDLGEVDMTRSFRVETGRDGAPVVRVTGPENDDHPTPGSPPGEIGARRRAG